MKYSLILILLFLVSLTYAQETKQDINRNLDNYTFSRAYEDTVNFRTKNIYSVRNYKAVKKGKLPANVKIFKSKPFLITAYTEYLPDGRRRYKKYSYSEVNRTEKYYYSANFDKLMLLETVENDRVSHQQTVGYNWLFYDKNTNLIEDFSYKITGKDHFIFDGYTRYNFEYLKEETKVRVQNYSSDTIADPIQNYVFSAVALTKAKPEYQSKWQKFKFINGVYRPIETKGFIFENRNVDFTYDKNGFILSETWNKPSGRLENKIEYGYSKDYRERVEQLYDMLGTNRSTKMVRKYDVFGNLIFEQPIEGSGNPLGIKHIEYVYDDKGNWLEKKIYEQPCRKGVYGTKELTSHEMREIEYYGQGQSPHALVLPLFPQKAKDIKGKVTRWSVGAAKRKKARQEEQDY